MFAAKRSPRSLRKRLAVFATALTLAGGGLVVSNFVSAQEATDTPLIVGLGDSFTSGVGATPLDEGSGICRRTTNSYPLEAARALGYEGTNAACSGATVSALNTSFRGQLPQSERVQGADYVVMTIGGNDVLTLGNIASLVTESAQLDQRLVDLEAQLNESISTVLQNAPDAEVMLLAYPKIFPAGDTSSCTGLPTAAIEAANSGFDKLNSTIATSAETNGVQFLDTSDAFAGHDVCSPEPYATGFTDLDVAFHPNDAGHAAMGQAVVEAIETEGPVANDTAAPASAEESTTSTTATTTTKAGPADNSVAEPVDDGTELPAIQPISATDDSAAKHETQGSEKQHKEHGSKSPQDSDKDHDTHTKQSEPEPEFTGQPTATQQETPETQPEPSPMPTQPTKSVQSPPEQGQTTASLPVTGSETPATLAIGCLLLSLGMAAMWLRMRIDAPRFG